MDKVKSFIQLIENDIAYEEHEKYKEEAKNKIKEILKQQYVLEGLKEELEQWKQNVLKKFLDKN